MTVSIAPIATIHLPIVGAGGGQCTATRMVMPKRNPILLIRRVWAQSIVDMNLVESIRLRIPVYVVECHHSALFLWSKAA